MYGPPRPRRRVPGVGIIQRIGTGLASAFGFTPLVKEASLNFASVHAGDHLERIAFEDFYGAIEPYIATNRTNAMTVGTVAALRNAIAGTGSRLGLYTERAGARTVKQPTLLAGLERGVPLATTLAWLIDDLFFYPNAYLRVTERDAYGWPTWTLRVPRGEARFDAEGRLIAHGDTPVRPEDVIRFDSPLAEGFLATASRTIKRAIAIELAAALAEDSPIPAIELHNESDQVLSDEQRDSLLDSWTAARRKRGVAYTPKNIKAIAHGKPTEQLLIEGRRALSLDLVRHGNAPAWIASTAVEGANLTYENRGSRNWELIDLTLANYFTAIAGRLAMDDITPHGWTVKFDTDQLTLPDMKTRFETYGIGLDKGFIDKAWIAAREGWATVPGEDTP